MYIALTYDVIKSYVTRVWGKKIRNGYITWKQGLLCDKNLFINKFIMRFSWCLYESCSSKKGLGASTFF